MGDFGIACQECFNAEATMQNNDGTYLCHDCYVEKDEAVERDFKQEVNELTNLLDEFFRFAEPKLAEHGHGCTYYFKELHPDLYERIVTKLAGRS